VLGVCVGFVLYVLAVSVFALYLLGRFIRAVVFSLIAICASILVCAIFRRSILCVLVDSAVVLSLLVAIACCLSTYSCAWRLRV